MQSSARPVLLSDNKHCSTSLILVSLVCLVTFRTVLVTSGLPTVFKLSISVHLLYEQNSV